MSKKIKNEQKKFLGETLNQYDKALNEGINQLDKKNREQNHKISSLTNSFDNEYLEKDVEGNMTTLENSKDGMVIINEIQGNTEVNYCKDGEKELILNGDIDTQGESFVTLTEGVDGGLVDVSLEGNTEINLSSTKDPVLVTREFDDINCNAGKLQYTIDDVTTINDEPGKVDIDRIVGDTMVNHAVNGSEELILNAHIDESGDNNITLNGVTSEGGKVDVALEGNTMVNVCDQKDPVALPCNKDLTYLYANTQYAVQFVSDKAVTADITLGGTQLLDQSIVAGLNRITITTPETLADNKLIIDGVGANIKEVVVTNSNREFGYFEGMKSVGECEGNIEILSRNKNLFDLDNYLQDTQTVEGLTLTKIDNNTFRLQGTCTGNYRIFYNTKQTHKLKPNTTYVSKITLIDGVAPTKGLASIHCESPNGGKRYRNSLSLQEPIALTTSNESYYIKQFIIEGLEVGAEYDCTYTIQLEEGSTAIDYIPHAHNTQTLTHEPLRAVGDVKDRYVLIDGKWYIERKCNEVILNSLQGVNSSADDILTTNNVTTARVYISYNSTTALFPNIKTEVVAGITPIDIICDKLPSKTVVPNMTQENQIAIGKTASGVSLRLYGTTVAECENWLNNNPLKITYVLQSPVYEEIDYNPLEVYQDITHISTNSTIPTNITVKNHGYNLVALKENTQYTLYVDKNTTNALTYRLGDYVEINSLSKFTFTTPSTLTDKTLRIDGKGAKVKDLMLIEGTPTNDSIGYFDGLKSSYECEKVTDESDENYGKYKVDVKVVGKNLCPNKFYSGWSDRLGTLYSDDNVVSELIKVKPNSNYTINKENFSYLFKYDSNKKFIGQEVVFQTFNTKNAVYIRMAQSIGASDIHLENYDNTIQIEEGNTATEYEPYFESKQTIYLNSPLIKGDEIVWKDNKIQHYHKMETMVFDGSDDESWVTQSLADSDTTLGFRNQANISSKEKANALSDRFVNIYSWDKVEHMHFNRNALNITISKSKLQTQDVAGFRRWLQANPTTVVYELATPYYEEISDYPLKLNVIANSSLSTESTIQVTNISFNIYEETLPYLYPNTKYYITFNADVDRNNIIIDLGGSHVALDCKVGFNKVEITTPSDTTNLLTFSGTGVNIDHVKVTQQDIDEYFEGMKSVGECEELEITSANSDNTLSNTQTLTHEPLRAVGEVKDRYVMIDGKWFIERNCNEAVLEGSDDEVYTLLDDNFNNVKWFGFNLNNKEEGRAHKSICSKFINSNLWADMELIQDAGTTSAWNCNTFIAVSKSKLSSVDVKGLKEWLIKNPTVIVYKLATPIYEPINYNPFEVYSDTTYISTNSLIPTNMVIKNHGYNCILKPSTKYTVALNKPNGTISAKLGGSAKVDSTSSIFTITTPSTLNDNILRLSCSGSVKDIMILEGDKTINTPSYFEGIESVFEQEYDAEKGKYRVTARVEGNGKESSIIFYIDKPLRGVEDSKDKAFIRDGKVIVERKCDSYTFDGSDDEEWMSAFGGSWYIGSTTAFISYRHVEKVDLSHKFYCDNFILDGNFVKGDVEQIALNSGGVGKYACIRILNSKLATQDVNGFKQWLQHHPTTVVYKLAEPVYEEVDCDLSKLVLENYENSSLIFESNIPVSANIRYSGEVPVVTQAKALSSKVDNTTLDINENIIPYMCDIDYRIVELQLMNGDTQGEGIELLGIGDIEILGNGNVLFNNREDKKYNYSYDMLKRDILSQRYSKEEYQYRLDRYLLANKISNEEYKELEGLLNNGE